ncbi:MAG: helix-turn-helix domain-containing protein [Huintestinicola sp.]
MNTDFPRIITLLRKERNISQKQAAADLGVSQALLSHYEKGIRECGLEFLVKTADYYGVSCDYLLGRCAEPCGASPADTMPSVQRTEQPADTEASTQQSNQSRQMLSDSQRLIFSMLSSCKSAALENEVIKYLSLAAYRIFRVLYSANPRNDRRFFTVDEPSADGFTLAAMEKAKAKAQASAIHSDMQNLQITTNMLSEQYHEYSSALLNTIKRCESDIKALSETSENE